MTDLGSVARALGGEAMSRGRVLCPGPGHSPSDRSLCVWFNGDDFTCHSFANDPWRDCKDHVRSLIGGDKYQFHVEQPPTQLRTEHDEDMLAKARHLWGCRSEDTFPVSRYLRHARGYTGPLPATIGFLPAGQYADPAMIATFGLGDEIHGVHLTFLKADGSDKADRKLQRITIGPSKGWPIVVAEPNDLLGLAICESIEDALSIHQATGLGAWAAGSWSRMEALADTIPGCIECVTVCGHDDLNGAGQRGVSDFAKALASSRPDIEILIEESLRNENGSRLE